MRFEYERISNGGRFECSGGEEARASGVLRVVAAFGRGCVMYGNAAPATVLVPLRGRVQMCDGDGTRVFAPGELLVVEAGQRLQLIGRGNALWIAVLAPARVWHRLTGHAGTAVPMHDPVLLPAVHGADHATRRLAIALARTADFRSRERHSVDFGAANATAAAFATAIADLQSEFDAQIERCPGCTQAQRRSVFLRLQRVRNLMTSSCHLALDIAELARMTSYSPCHFIRVFSAVYGDTPHAVLVEQRMRSAHRLLSNSALAVTDVARMSGFEDRCAFARSFKRRFGMTATDLRGESPAASRAVA